MQPTNRTVLQHLTKEQISPLEAFFTAQWSDAWRDFACSFYVTLITRPKPLSMDASAELAVQLVYGIARDFGGTQPYIPSGAGYAFEERRKRVLELIKEGRDYLEVARMTGLTSSRVRNIEREVIKDRRKKTTSKAQESIPGRPKTETHPKGAASPFKGL